MKSFNDFIPSLPHCLFSLPYSFHVRIHFPEPGSLTTRGREFWGANSRFNVDLHRSIIGMIHYSAATCTANLLTQKHISREIQYVVRPRRTNQMYSTRTLAGTTTTASITTLQEWQQLLIDDWNWARKNTFISLCTDSIRLNRSRYIYTYMYAHTAVDKSITRTLYFLPTTIAAFSAALVVVVSAAAAAASFSSVVLEQLGTPIWRFNLEEVEARHFSSIIYV